MPRHGMQIDDVDLVAIFECFERLDKCLMIRAWQTSRARLLPLDIGDDGTSGREM